MAASQQEPVLLVGETGTGKTTLVQHLAEQVSPAVILISLHWAQALQHTFSIACFEWGAVCPAALQHDCLKLRRVRNGLISIADHCGGVSVCLARSTGAMAMMITMWN